MFLRLRARLKNVKEALLLGNERNENAVLGEENEVLGEENIVPEEKNGVLGEALGSIVNKILYKYIDEK